MPDHESSTEKEVAAIRANKSHSFSVEIIDGKEVSICSRCNGIYDRVVINGEQTPCPGFIR